MLTVEELKEKQKQKEDKIKEYKLTDEAVRLASIIILDGIVCKDRWDFSTGSYIGESPMNVTNTNLIIGYNGHLIYTTGQEGVPKVQFLNIPNKPKDVIQVIHYVPNKKLIGIVEDYFGSLLGMEYEWNGENWQKVANLGHDIELIKRKYGV